MLVHAPDSATLPRIALLLPDLAGGGAERVVALLAGEFAQRGYPVDLLLGRAEGPFRDAVSAAVNVHALVGRAWPRNAACLAPAMVLGLRRYLARTNPAVLMSSITGANLVACAVKFLSRSNVQLVIREANTSANRRSALRTWACRRLYPQASAFIGNSMGVVEDLIRDLNVATDRVHLIHNPIDLDYLQREAQSPSPHTWFDDGGPPVVLGMGRLTEQKGFDVLLSAMAELTRRRPARLIVLGEGPEAESLRRQARALGISHLTQFVGFQVNPYSWLGRCDVFCLPSRWEGFPQTLVEALALGRRVVASDCHSGPREMLQGGRYGLLVPVDEAEPLAEAISWALDQPHDSAMQLARVEDFDLAAQAQKYLDPLLAGYIPQSDVDPAQVVSEGRM